MPANIGGKHIFIFWIEKQKKMRAIQINLHLKKYFSNHFNFDFNWELWVLFSNPETEYRIYQFPKDQMPRIDGDFGDWKMVPDFLFYWFGSINGYRTRYG